MTFSSRKIWLFFLACGTDSTLIVICIQMTNTSKLQPRENLACKYQWLLIDFPLNVRWHYKQMTNEILATNSTNLFPFSWRRQQRRRRFHSVFVSVVEQWPTFTNSQCQKNTSVNQLTLTPNKACSSFYEQWKTGLGGPAIHLLWAYHCPLYFPVQKALTQLCIDSPLTEVRWTSPN